MPATCAAAPLRESAKGRNAAVQEWRMDWDDIRVFLAVARAGSLARGAREVGVDRSTPSRRIAALEAALGVAGVVGVATTEALGVLLVEEGLLGLRDLHPDLCVEILGGNRPVDLARGE